VTERPNILLLISHDSGRHLGCYGADVPTPHLERLAGEGLRFDACFCTAPQCSPSRASLMTGLYPQQHGLMELEHLRERMELRPDCRTLPGVLAEHGYETRLIGFQHEHHDARRLGYAHVDQPWPPYRAADLAARVEAFLQAAPRTPFFLNAGFLETHRPFPPVEGDGAALRLPPWMDDTAVNRRDLLGFRQRAADLDAAVGRVDAALRRAGLAQNTILIYTTDHGTPFDRAKMTLFDAGLETALIVRWPGVTPAGKSCPALLSNVDLMPTLLEAAGSVPPAGIAGKSFLPALRGEAFAGREEIFGALTYHVQYLPQRCIRTRRHKYVRFYDSAALAPLLPREVAADSVIVPGHVAGEALYDLTADPGERNDVAGGQEHRACRDELAARLDAWLEDTGDPIRVGPVNKW
jgi:arylsulfatase A-like enzyme